MFLVLPQLGCNHRGEITTPALLFIYQPFRPSGGSTLQRKLVSLKCGRALKTDAKMLADAFVRQPADSKLFTLTHRRALNSHGSASDTLKILCEKQRCNEV